VIYIKVLEKIGIQLQEKYALTVSYLNKFTLNKHLNKIL